MARPLERIADINDKKELWKVAVRVHHKWMVVSNNKEHFEMIFIDKEGDDIHAVVTTTHMAAFYDKIAQDHTYTVSNFKVQPNVSTFKPSSHKFMVKFTGGTSVGDDDKHEIPPKPLKFTSFSDIITGRFKKDVLIDIIGMVDSIGFSVAQSGAKKQQVNLVLRDHSNNTLNCTLWESYADQFIKFNQDRVNASAPTVVLLQYAKVKEEGKFPLSVTNTYNVTMLYLDADFLPIKEFIDNIPKDLVVSVSGQLSCNSQLTSQGSENTQQTPVQKLLSKAVVMPLTEITKLTDITFCATVAETKILVASPFGWYYRACHLCPRVARGDKPPFLCEAGHSTEAEIFRYKIEIEVCYSGKSCNFVFWDRECAQILDLSAAQMRDTMIQAGIHDPLEFPLALDAMLNLEMAFKVKWHPRWKNCSVVMILRDDPFIKQLKAPWELPLQAAGNVPSKTSELLQIKESVDEARTEAPEECDLVTDLEITSKHNPDPITPTSKRQLPDGSSESTTFEGLSEGELSSNKLKKIIKMEKKD
ncbi:uncharacterized protein LOC131623307 isoform X2 [Vicia villosa]|uniref:uncharacterized protein LOC131603397 isoform X2 n=1 Tax=Vicia villosa TaxID=3911 RepID=UPI00273B4E4C|nr:uncharacterized protein LOC131603397 isoform X2 [Vicia villosa]XP_058750292.1 uncharacterized protein LOC131623307 isoform X2 [Vicia villosa]